VGKMKKLYRRENLFKISVPILTVLTISVSLELFSWFYIKYFSVPTTSFDFRIKQPAPYKNAEYFSKEFIMESFFQPGKWKYTENGDIIPEDFNGRFFRTSGGFRNTSFQPKKFDHTVHIFGGSTMYCCEVPDEYTIASYLQTYFNKQYPKKYLVKNYGIPAIAILEQLKRLKTVDVKPDDIVIFYDGVNEIFLNLYYANKNSSIARIAVNNMNTLSWILKLALYLSDNSYFVRLFINPVKYAIPEHLNDQLFLDKMLTETAFEYKTNIKEAHKYTAERNGHFFHFLQPHLFSDEKLTEYEKKLSTNKYLVLPGAEISFKAGYPVLRDTVSHLPKEINSYDITHILNERPENEEYFLDNLHVNHLANEKIAQKIFKEVSAFRMRSDRTSQLHLQK